MIDLSLKNIARMISIGIYEFITNYQLYILLQCHMLTLKMTGNASGQVVATALRLCEGAYGVAFIFQDARHFQGFGNDDVISLWQTTIENTGKSASLIVLIGKSTMNGQCSTVKLTRG